MTDNAPAPDATREVLLKKIDGKLAWICFFLILITLNTCSLEERVSDALRDMRDDDAPAGDGIPRTVSAEPATAPTEEK